LSHALNIHNNVHSICSGELPSTVTRGRAYGRSRASPVGQQGYMILLQKAVVLLHQQLAEWQKLLNYSLWLAPI